MTKPTPESPVVDLILYVMRQRNWTNQVNIAYNIKKEFQRNIRDLYVSMALNKCVDEGKLCMRKDKYGLAYEYILPSFYMTTKTDIHIV